MKSKEVLEEAQALIETYEPPHGAASWENYLKVVRELEILLAEHNRIPRNEESKECQTTKKPM
jgi:hypothetical protein